MDQRSFCWLKSFVININDVLPIKVRNQQKHVPPLQDKMEGKKWNSSTIKQLIGHILAGCARTSRILANSSVPFIVSVIAQKVRFHVSY